MSATDYIISGLLLWGFISGFRKGIVMQLCMLAGLLVGIWLAIHSSEKAAQWLGKQMGTDTIWLKQMGFILVFATVYVLAWMGGKALSKTLSLVQLGLVNKLAGGFFGILKVLLLLSLLFYLLGLSGWLDTGWQPFQDSVIHQPLSGFGKQLYQLLR